MGVVCELDPETVEKHLMTEKAKSEATGSSVRCPKCGSAEVRRDFLKRINIGCLLVTAFAFVTLLENQNHFARVCRNCGHRFVN